MKKVKKKDNNFWADGYFSETVSSDDVKMRTFHMKHDEEMNFNCHKCRKKISAHNKDWHDGMCDDCFNDAYFPEEQRADEESRGSGCKPLS